MKLAIVAFVLLPALAAAQDLGVPTSWRKFSNSRPLSERISISKRALDAMNSNALTSTGEYSGIGFWQSGNVYSELANHDWFSGTTTYRSLVLDNLNKVYAATGFDKEGYNDDALWWAQSSYYAYRAYKDTNALAHAEAVWSKVSQFFISQSVANSGSMSGKSFTIAGTCSGKTMVGGVFWRPGAGDQSVNSVTTGLYATLSAYLAEATKDVKYTNAAIASVNWLRNVNMKSNYIMKDTINGHDCSIPNDWIFTYNTGKTIEALAVLGSVTGDAQWTNLMSYMVAAATKQSPWQDSDGIITEGANTSSNDDGAAFKSILIRALTEVYARYNAGNFWNLGTLVHSYIDVQYNALLDIANNGQGFYSNAWKNSYPVGKGFFTWGQLSALPVMVGAIKAN